MKMDAFEIETIKALRELEIPSHILGYTYIKEAMKVMNENPQAIYQVTKTLYPTIAERHNTKPSRVERGIRHALEICHSDFLTQKKVLGTARDLTNSEFLATLHEVIKIKLATEGESDK